MIEAPTFKQVLESAVRNGAMNEPEQTFAVIKLRPEKNLAAFKSGMCIQANSRLDHPDSMEEARSKGLNHYKRLFNLYLIAGDCGINGKATYIKYVPDISENHIIESGEKHLFMYQIYSADNGKNSARVSNADKADPIFDRDQIAREIVGFQINARKKAKANRRPVNA